MAEARPRRPGLLILLLMLVCVSVACGWFFRAEYYIGELRSAAAAVDQADTPEHQGELRSREDQLVGLGAANRGRIYRELSDSTGASPTLDRALVRCALRSYLAQPMDDRDELLGAITLGLQRQPNPGAGGIWQELGAMDMALWTELVCRVWPGLTPAQQAALRATKDRDAAQLDCSQR